MEASEILEVSSRMTSPTCCQRNICNEELGFLDEAEPEEADEEDEEEEVIVLRSLSAACENTLRVGRLGTGEEGDVDDDSRRDVEVKCSTYNFLSRSRSSICVNCIRDIGRRVTITTVTISSESWSERLMLR
jgi:hypothetical protein